MKAESLKILYEVTRVRCALCDVQVSVQVFWGSRVGGCLVCGRAEECPKNNSHLHHALALVTMTIELGVNLVIEWLLQS